MSGIENDIMNNKSKMDTEDREERIVDIYVSAETVRDVKHKPMENPKPPQHTGSDCVKMRSSRAAPVCLVLLYFLLLTAVIVLCVFIYTNNTYYTQERNQLLVNITNLTEERFELQNKNTDLTEEKQQLLIQNENLTSERKQLIFQKDNVTKERDQLKSERNELQINLGGGWHYYHSSIYIISSELKCWTESRKYCTERGADLMIINSIQEEDFVMNITQVKISGQNEHFWIGLTDSKKNGNWKWVDGTNMTSGFWASEEPNGQQAENCALIYSPGLSDFPCSENYKCICEKTIFK